MIQDVRFSDDGQEIFVRTELGVFTHNADLAMLGQDFTLDSVDEHFNNDNPELPSDFTREIVAFSPDKTLLAVNDDNIVTIYRWPSLEIVSTVIPSETTTMDDQNRHDFSRKVSALTFSPDAAILAVGMQPTAYVTQGGSAIELFQVSNGEMILQLPQSNNDDFASDFDCDGIHLAEPSGPAFVEKISFSPDGRFLAASFSYWSDFAPTRTRLYRVEDGAFIHEFDPGIESIAFSPDSQMLVTGLPEGLVQLWGVNAVALLQTAAGYEAMTTELKFSKDGQYLAAKSDVGINLYQTSDGSIAADFPSATALSFSDLDKTYAIGYADGTVEWRSLDGNQILNSAQAHSGKVFGLEFVAQSDELLSSGADCRWAMWQSGTLVQSLPPYLSPSIWADTPAGPTGMRYISSLGDSGAVALTLSNFPSDFREHPEFVLFHLADGEFIEVTDDFPAYFDAVVFSENGRYLVLDGPLSVWKLNDDLSYLPIWISQQFASPNLVFSADAQLLVAENQLFLAESGEFAATLPYGETEFSSVVFSEDGRFLAVATVDGLIHLWGIP
ncbi:WD40 repeat domain-containing protein [Candidatus Leptofilum sp.]|uniref:WD40 repeat domain-containing protein n=1 Tax=Candidatus Leptofilum sp. TaxID=3241576 RepID=UPI003B5A2B13